MERRETKVIGRRADGSKIVRHTFVNDNPPNHMAVAHSHFTKAERREAKREHQLEMKKGA